MQSPHTLHSVYMAPKKSPATPLCPPQETKINCRQDGEQLNDYWQALHIFMQEQKAEGGVGIYQTKPILFQVVPGELQPMAKCLWIVGCSMSTMAYPAFDVGGSRNCSQITLSETVLKLPCPIRPPL